MLNPPYIREIASIAGDGDIAASRIEFDGSGTVIDRHGSSKHNVAIPCGGINRHTGVGRNDIRSFDNKVSIKG